MDIGSYRFKNASTQMEICIDIILQLFTGLRN